MHMTDMLAGRRSLREFKGLVACGGFSYGDVLGAGEGWAKSILFHEAAREEFAALLRTRRHLRARHLQWLPDVRRAEEPDSRHRALAALRAQSQRAVRGPLHARGNTALALGAAGGHGGSVLPIAVSHGEGQAEFATPRRLARVRRAAGWSASATFATIAPWQRLSLQSERLAVRDRGPVQRATAG